jgi:hypothetical protein
MTKPKGVKKFFRCKKCQEMTSGYVGDDLCPVCKSAIKKNAEAKKEVPTFEKKKWEKLTPEEEDSSIIPMLKSIGINFVAVPPATVIDANHPDFESMCNLYGGLCEQRNNKSKR